MKKQDSPHVMIRNGVELFMHGRITKTRLYAIIDEAIALGRTMPPALHYCPLCVDEVDHDRHRADCGCRCHD